METDAPVGQDGAENTRGKRRFWEVEDDLPEATMLIDLTSIAAEVKADEQSIKVTTDENIDREGGDLDLTLTWWRLKGAEAGEVAETNCPNV